MRTSIERKIKWSTQIGIALEYMHTRTPPLAHGDVDCRNIIIRSNGDAVLCDFDRSWLEGLHHSRLSLLPFFPRFVRAQNRNADVLVAMDHVLFGLFLVSVR